MRIASSRELSTVGAGPTHRWPSGLSPSTPHPPRGPQGREVRRDLRRSRFRRAEGPGTDATDDLTASGSTRPSTSRTADRHPPPSGSS
ncbi:hypothetical protein TOK_2595 [Pseudonocardia sp. N23]|nr:hypothetical protein TOK_2595 [Pseudonocardia sp. N23]